jgi:hypothetical protein
LVGVSDAVARLRSRTARVRTAAVRTALGLAVGAVLVLTFLKVIGASAVYHRLAHLDVGVEVLCGATFLIAYVIRALRWRCLLRPAG